MLNDIIKMREQGISFRKIAKELGTTVGKVQYQWVKHQKMTDSAEGAEAVKAVVKTTAKRTGKMKKRAALRPGRLDVPEAHDFMITYSTFSRVYCYWNVSQKWIEHTRSQFNLEPHSPFVLRVYDITSIIFNGHNHHSYMDCYVPHNECDWFLNGLKENRSYCVDLGLRLPSGEFLAIKRSNVIHTPIVSEAVDYCGMKELRAFEEGKISEPKWVEHVSTYSYYVTSKGDES
ncbi:DUF4912 domain-containing protein [Rossellomorea aquimaris]|uniref:DUF4912 domain-containing protein n=1 Tax=Rossellomorea aquimaris TaxID=189382 RepID=UPI001CD4EE62|nr:DUF4912 domain-containing protein [Rossellomorea aquimaris]MCA1054834.1 DUF4912 domain-containing protein [Rossellomorea aquimaris]